MVRQMLKSKIHRATVTEANLNYEGSITIDRALMEVADVLPFERVQVLNVHNGERFETYAIPGERGTICVNGAAARLVQPGDLVLILTYVDVPDDQARSVKPRIIRVDDRNRPVQPELSPYPTRGVLV